MNGRHFIVLVALLMALVPSARAMQYAGTRALVSRARADMRSTSVALESYFSDHGIYPAGTGSPEWQIAPGVLTTPVAYLTADFADVFKQRCVRPLLFPSLPFLAPLLFAIGLILTLAALLTAVHQFLNMRTGGGAKTYRGLLRVFLICCVVSTVFSWFVFPIGFFSGPDVRIVRNVEWESRPQRFGYHTDGLSAWILQSLGPDGDRTLDDLSAVPLAVFPEAILRWLNPFTYDPTNGTASAGDIFWVPE